MDAELACCNEPLSQVNCHIPFPHAFTALRCVFEVLTVGGQNKLSASKMQCNAENACENWMWQLAFNEWLFRKRMNWVEDDDDITNQTGRLSKLKMRQNAWLGSQSIHPSFVSFKKHFKSFHANDIINLWLSPHL